MTLGYIDIIPGCLEHGGLFSEAEYERFDVLMNNANKWLRNRPDIRVLNCESIELKLKSDGYVLPEKMSFFERAEQITRYVRALRLWLRPRTEYEPPEPQQLGYWNLVPTCVSNDLFSNPKFEPLTVMLERINSSFRNQPLGGSILNVETQDMKFHHNLGTADPDECSWRESGKKGVIFVMVLRIFYVVGQPAYEELGCADFVPRNKGSFGSMLQDARQWVSSLQGLRFINLQSIDYKLKKHWDGEALDTHRTSYWERGEGYTHYVRIIRVCYGRPVEGGNAMMMPPPMPMPQLNYHTFVPVMLSGGGFGSPEYETMSKTWSRCKAWLEAAGVTAFLSAETVPIRLYTGRQHGDHEVTYTHNNGSSNDTWLFVLRVYMDGPYREPPVSALPPSPQTYDDDCCTLL